MRAFVHSWYVITTMMVIRRVEPAYSALYRSGANAKSRQDLQYMEIKSGHTAIVIEPPVSEMPLAFA